MNVTELRAALRWQAATVSDHGTEERVAQVHARVRGVRRRRIAGAAAVTVAALAVVSAVVALPDRQAAPADRLGPVDTVPSAPLPTTQHEGFVPHSGEFDLVAATIGEMGESELALTIPAHAEELHVAMVCHGVPGPINEHWVSGYVGDRPARPYSLWCGEDPETPVVPGTYGSAPGPWDYDDGLRVGPSTDPQTIHVELTQELDEDGRLVDDPGEMGTYTPVLHPGVVLGIGVYKIADPVTTVAGTKIRPKVAIEGADYAYTDHRTSGPGERTLTWTLEPSNVERYYDVVSENSTAEGSPLPSVHASLDGEFCTVSWSFQRWRAGGCLLSAGEPHTITVTMDPGLPENAVAGIVLYERVG